VIFSTSATTAQGATTTTAQSQPDGPLRGLVNATIGAKLLMALSGLGLAGFLLTHMAGNLQVFLGPEALNIYAAKLKELGPLLWVARGGLLAMFVLHVGLAFHLDALARSARPVRYEFEKTKRASWASRHMMLTGALVAVFLAYHLLHFTLGATHPDHFQGVDLAGRHDVHRMVVLGFRNKFLAVGYVLAMGLLAVHLSHGLESLWRTLGVSSKPLVQLARRLAIALSVALAFGFAAVPICVQTKLILLEGESPGAVANMDNGGGR